MANISGSAFNNVLFGTYLADRIYGNGGDDVIMGGRGYDRLFGGNGNDVIDGGNYRDTILGGNGDDVVIGGVGSDLLYGDNNRPGAASTSSALVTTTNGTTIPSTGDDFTVSLTAPDASNASGYAVKGLVSNSLIAGGSGVNIALVLDVSGSTGSTYSGTAVGDQNNYGGADEILDGEIAGAAALIRSIVNAGYGNAMVNLITFASGVEKSVTMRANADTNNNGVYDLIEELRSLRDGGGTSFEPPLQEAISFFNGRPAGGSNYVFFLSDGSASTSSIGDETATLTNPGGINATIKAFPIGSYANDDALDILDDGIDNASAPTVTDPGAISAALSGSAGITASDVSEVQIWVDGTLVKTIAPSALKATAFGLQYYAYLDGNDGVSGADPESIRVVAVANDGAGTAIATSQVVEKLVTEGDDTMTGGYDNDTMFGEGGDDVMYGNEGGDRMFGASGSDTIGGGAGWDRLYGGTGNDVIWGGIGNDIIQGGPGWDRVVGGWGADKFVFADGADYDIVKGFANNVDTLVLNDNLWGGQNLTPTQVVNRFASVGGGNTYFNFGGGDVLVIENFTTPSYLINDIDIV